MTQKQLSQLYRLNREIEQDKRRLAELESAATSPGSQITGLPHASGISDKTGNYAILIGGLVDEIKKKNDRTLILYKELTEYINGLDDSFIRQLLMLRCVDGFTWEQCAAHMGCGNTWKNLSNIYYRFVDKNLRTMRN